MDILKCGNDVFQKEINAVTKVQGSLGPTFIAIANAINSCTGKLVITGMGKSGHIARKLAATFSSLGVPSFFLHPGEAMHGDLGTLSKNDVVMALSYSGESTEVVSILPNIRRIGPLVIGITSNGDSSLAKYSDLCEVFPSYEEAGSLKLAPTSSTTAALVYGDALAITVSEMRNFEKEQFGLYHPGGSLGKSLIYKVKDLMDTGNDNPIIPENSTLKDALIVLSMHGLGLVSVVNSSKELLGVITDGTIKRALDQRIDIYNSPIKSFLIPDPISINFEAMAIDALKILNDNAIKSMPVLKDGICIGLIRKSEITKIGIYIK